VVFKGSRGPEWCEHARAIEAIKGLGDAAELQRSVWFVSSLLTAAEATERVWETMDPNDGLLVVDASNNEPLIRPTNSEAAADVKDGWNESARTHMA